MYPSVPNFPIRFRWSMFLGIQPTLRLGVVIGLCLLNFGLSAQSSVTFFQGPIESLQSQARETGRPYLLYFCANWSEPCQQMDMHTYRSPGLVSYLNQHYLVYRVDVSANDRGMSDLPNRYQVFLFPTLVICSPSGEVLSELSGYVSASKLMTELAPYAPTKASDGIPSKQHQAISDAPAVEAAEQLVALPHLPVESVEPAEPAQAFVVQVGVYGNYNNVEREIERLSARYHQPVQVISGHLQGSAIYRVVVGPFPAISQAQQFLRAFQAQEHRAGIIKEYADF